MNAVEALVGVLFLPNQHVMRLKRLFSVYARLLHIDFKLKIELPLRYFFFSELKPFMLQM